MPIQAVRVSSRDGEYPSSSEEKLPNIPWHRILLNMLIQCLQWHFRASPRVAVEGDVFVYYRRGVPTAFVGPDVFVVRDCDRRPERRWQTWQDGALDLVIELLSESSAEADQGEKLELYRDVMKVREYFLFDPEGGLMTPRLRGFRLVGEEYVAIEPVNGRLPSEVTGLHLEQAGNALRLWDPEASAWVPTDAERAEQAEAARVAASARAADEARRADAAEKRLRELEAELARRGGMP